jgi:hypothetical protein
MRIIKLSPDDIDFGTRIDLDRFFTEKLLERDPVGRFNLPKGWIANKGLEVGELLAFTYHGMIVYIACSASERLDSEGLGKDKYPHYFCIDVDTIRPAKGSLVQLEEKLDAKGLLDRNIVRSQGWPTINERDDRRRKLESILEGFVR